MGMQRYTRSDIYNSVEYNEELRPNSVGEFVKAADALEREWVLREALAKIRILAEASQLCGDRPPAVTAQTLIPLIDAALAQ